MNYYRVQSTYFLMFILISAIAFVAVPVMKDSFSSISDSYVKSQMKRIQTEMFFIDQGRGSFRHTCYTGSVGIIIRDLIQEYGKKVVCRTDKPLDSKVFIYVELRSGAFLSVDYLGVSCEYPLEPSTVFSCKEL